MTPSDLIIVVGRQFGSGGRKIGKALAKHYGLDYYDKEMLSEAAVRFGMNPDIFARYDEKRPSPLRSLLSNAFGVAESYENSMSSESIYQRQSYVIRQLAEKKGCVFVGRSADYILREHPHLVSIFLHAPIEHRAKAILDRGDAKSIDKAKEFANKIDASRENFYNYFAGSGWGHADNYHLTLNSALLGEDATLEVIKSYIDNRFK
ncbi:MAG: cytidylate kinase-like family protein [Muribaculaceae bacterium]|nr:cytidylate kinase-like family protein [Muribaculaceae bacterium]MDE6559152.1 cytidylate kinase-like family protein [Muribaculaceae bacterium]